MCNYGKERQYAALSRIPRYDTSIFVQTEFTRHKYVFPMALPPYNIIVAQVHITYFKYRITKVFRIVGSVLCKQPLQLDVAAVSACGIRFPALPYALLPVRAPYILSARTGIDYKINAFNVGKRRFPRIYTLPDYRF